MDGKELFENRELLVFVSDQKAFTFATSGAHACTLYPLMTLSGEVINPTQEAFPNQGRVWWHLKDTSPELALPGVIWVGELETHPGYSISDPRKSRFQAGFDKKISRGHNQLIEILDIDADSPDLELVQRGGKFPWPRPPLATVILKGHRKMLGPLKCSWDLLSQELSFSPVTTVTSISWVMNTKDFEEVVTTRRFDVPINEVAYYGTHSHLQICLTRQDWFNEEIAKKIGKPVDISTDEQIINWAVKQKIVEMSNAEKATVKRFVSSLAENPAESADLKIERLQLLAQDFDRVINVGETAAKILADSENFAELLKKHIDVVVAEDIRQEKIAKKAEIEHAIEPLVRRKKSLNQDIKTLEAECEQKEKTFKKELAAKEKEVLGPLQKREAAVAAREEALESKEKMVTEALNQATARYLAEATKVSGEVLSHLPMMKEFFGTQGGAHASAQPQRKVSKRATLPSPRAKQFGSRISESDFVDQFSSVVDAYGFSFKQDDLINFHVCMKVSALTILAGMSGTGKSSLPRFYARALGAYDEYLEIPVRPDWLDDRDLMGFYNPLSQSYEPGRSGFVTHLITAAQDNLSRAGGIYITCLDEMNLARAEHYFSQFLSVLEKEPTERRVSLYPEGLGSEDDPFASYREIPLGENLRFVGTVNIDETTHFFSPKLVDRAQIVSLAGSELKPVVASGSQRKVEITPVSAETYDEWKGKGRIVSDETMKILRALHEHLKPSRVGFEHRAVSRMIDYIKAAQPLMDEDKAFDYQLTQVLLPKLRKSAPQFSKTVSKIMETVPQNRYPRSAEILSRLADHESDEEYFQLV